MLATCSRFLPTLTCELANLAVRGAVFYALNKVQGGSLNGFSAFVLGHFSTGDTKESSDIQMLVPQLIFLSAQRIFRKEKNPLLSSCGLIITANAVIYVAQQTLNSYFTA